MVGGVNELSTRLAVPPVASARGEIGIPREPISHTLKHVVSALDLRRKPGLNGTHLHGWPGTNRRTNTTPRLRCWPRFYAGRWAVAKVVARGPALFFPPWPPTRAISPACSATCRGRARGSAA